MTTPEQVPNELVAGDTWAWTRDLTDYPATTYTAVWYFENAAKVFSVVAGASGSMFTGAAAAATTAAYPPGRYRRRLVVTKISDSSRLTVDGEIGWLELITDPAAAGVKDWRSHYRRTLDAIEATIEGRASSDQSSMSINGRSLSRIPIEELLKFRDYYAGKVADEDNAEQVAAGQGNKRRAYVRLNRV